MTFEALVAVDLGHGGVGADTQEGGLEGRRDLRPGALAVGFDRDQLGLQRLQLAA